MKPDIKMMDRMRGYHTQQASKRPTRSVNAQRREIKRLCEEWGITRKQFMKMNRQFKRKEREERQNGTD